MSGSLLTLFNAAPAAAALEDMLGICHSTGWAHAILEGRPYASLAALEQAAQDCWQRASEADILEAFDGHARIGDLAALADRFSAAAREQGQVEQADPATLAELLRLNRLYEQRHGFIFVICAAGRSAEAMRDALARRLPRSRPVELAAAAAEQGKIIHLRLRQRFGAPAMDAYSTTENAMKGALLTSHVLDLQTGRPAAGLAACLYFAGPADSLITAGVTDEDGRIGHWQDAVALQGGDYRLVFVTGEWFEQQGRTTLYPRITVEFSVTETEHHYHIPLLLSPFGYSTYRGS